MSSNPRRARARELSNALPITVCLLACLVGAQTASAQGRFDDLLRCIPPSANAILVIDAEAVHASPLAVRERWKDQHEAEFVNRPLLLPPEADRMVLAAQMNPNREFEQAYELAVLTLTEPMSMRSIARAEGGYVDTVDGTEMVWTPSDAYFVDLGNNMLGVNYPAHRQRVGRWAQIAKQSQAVAISPYLQAAAGLVDRSTQIVMAVDLQNAVRPHILQEALAEAELTRDNPDKQRAWQGVIQGLEGVTLKVSLDESARGTLQVHFAGSPAVFGDEAKTLVLYVLDEYGASIDDLYEWKANLTSNSIELSGPLTKPAMRRIFSLLELPSDKFSTLKDAKPAPADDTESVAEASQRYFKSVSTLLDDIRKEFATNRDARRNLAPTYMERYARNIDRLPILNVDEELLAYGAAVAETMRDVSVSTRMAGVRTGVRKSSVYGNYQYTYNQNGYYYAYKNPTANIKNEMQRQEQAKATQVRYSSWKEIEDATAAIRNKMTRKYMVEF